MPTFALVTIGYNLPKPESEKKIDEVRYDGKNS